MKFFSNLGKKIFFVCILFTTTMSPVTLINKTGFDIAIERAAAPQYSEDMYYANICINNGELSKKFHDLCDRKTHILKQDNSLDISAKNPIRISIKTGENIFVEFKIDSIPIRYDSYDIELTEVDSSIFSIDDVLRTWTLKIVYYKTINGVKFPEGIMQTVKEKKITGDLNLKNCNWDVVD